MLKKISALLLLPTFIGTSLTLNVPNLEAKVIASDVKSISRSLSSINVPASLGHIQDSHHVANQPTVILVQDAHSVPEAQKNIYHLIEYFQKEYGIQKIALEGASNKLDPQFLRSYPDQKQLKKVLDEYFNRAELSGVSAAALMSPYASTYQGMEDWDLYQKGIGYFLEAMSSEAELQKKIEDGRKKLEAEKKKVYSKELLEIDEAMEKFYENKSDLIETLKVLSKFEAPSGELALILKKTTDHRPQSTALEIKRLAGVIEKLLKAKKIEDRKEKLEGNLTSNLKPLTSLTEFNLKKQSFNTSQISEEAYALYLTELAKKLGTDLNLRSVPGLLKAAEEERRLQNIQGTKLFKDFEEYVDQVVSREIATSPTAPRNDVIASGAKQSLYEKTKELRLLSKLIKLELTREEWQTFKKIENREEKLEAADFFLISNSKLLSSHINFYKNAEEREKAFLKNLEKKHSVQDTAYSELKRSTHDASRSTIIVAGGFHTEGIASMLKEKNISYVTVMPAIKQLPEVSVYKAQMQGEVSWKNYFKVQDGKIDLYSAFVRATRDKLVQSTAYGVQSEKNAVRSTHPAVLKNWRDQILIDLAQNKQIEKAGEYTRFIDEVSSGEGFRVRDLNPQWFENVETFFTGLGKLEAANQLNPNSVAALFKPSTATVDLISGALDPLGRSEMRNQNPRGQDASGAGSEREINYKGDVVDWEAETDPDEGYERGQSGGATGEDGSASASYVPPSSSERDPSDERSEVRHRESFDVQNNVEKLLLERARENLKNLALQRLGESAKMEIEAAAQNGIDGLARFIWAKADEEGGQASFSNDDLALVTQLLDELQSSIHGFQYPVSGSQQQRWVESVVTRTGGAQNITSWIAAVLMATGVVAAKGSSYSKVGISVQQAVQPVLQQGLSITASDDGKIVQVIVHISEVEKPTVYKIQTAASLDGPWEDFFTGIQFKPGDPEIVAGFADSVSPSAAKFWRLVEVPSVTGQTIRATDLARLPSMTVFQNGKPVRFILTGDLLRQYKEKFGQRSEVRIAGITPQGDPKDNPFIAGFSDYSSVRRAPTGRTTADRAFSNQSSLAGAALGIMSMVVASNVYGIVTFFPLTIIGIVSGIVAFAALIKFDSYLNSQHINRKAFHPVREARESGIRLVNSIFALRRPTPIQLELPLNKISGQPVSHRSEMRFQETSESINLAADVVTALKPGFTSSQESLAKLRKRVSVNVSGSPTGIVGLQSAAMDVLTARVLSEAQDSAFTGLNAIKQIKESSRVTFVFGNENVGQSKSPEAYVKESVNAAIGLVRTKQLWSVSFKIETNVSPKLRAQLEEVLGRIDLNRKLGVTKTGNPQSELVIFNSAYKTPLAVGLNRQIVIGSKSKGNASGLSFDSMNYADGNRLNHQRVQMGADIVVGAAAALAKDSLLDWLVRRDEQFQARSEARFQSGVALLTTMLLAGRQLISRSA